MNDKKLQALCKLVEKLFNDIYTHNSNYFTDEVKELLQIIKEE